jgi:hypothetical protein
MNPTAFAALGGIPRLPSADTLETLRWFVELADQLLDRDFPNHPVRCGLPDAVDWLDSAISRPRIEAPEIRFALAELDLIGSADVAAILECTQRRVQQLADEIGGLRIGNGYVFSRAAVIAYAERQRH